VLLCSIIIIVAIAVKIGGLIYQMPWWMLLFQEDPILLLLKACGVRECLKSWRQYIFNLLNCGTLTSHFKPKVIKCVFTKMEKKIFIVI
jgi:hypothetical protein